MGNPAEPNTGNAYNTLSYLGMGAAKAQAQMVDDAYKYSQVRSVMSNYPLIASGSSSTPQMLSNVGRGDSIPVYQHLCCPGQSAKSVSAPYQMSNAEAVKRAPHPCYSSGGVLQGQKPMPSPGTGPSFEKLAPKSMSTKPGPMGTDYKK